MFVVADTLTTTDPAVLGAVTGGDRRWLEVHARRLADAGAHAIDLNASSLGDAEVPVLSWMAEVVETVVDLPLSIDGPDLDRVTTVASGRRCPAIVNSWSIDAPVTDDLSAVLERPDTRLVVQLRDGQRLPANAADRRRWADEARSAWEARGVGPDRLFFDAVALPWGGDLTAGRGLLEFVAAFTADQPECDVIVGLGNVGHGHPDPIAAQRTWLTVLVEAGLGAVLLDPTRTELQPLWRG